MPPGTSPRSLPATERGRVRPPPGCRHRRRDRRALRGVGAGRRPRRRRVRGRARSRHAYDGAIGCDAVGNLRPASRLRPCPGQPRLPRTSAARVRRPPADGASGVALDRARRRRATARRDRRCRGQRRRTDRSAHRRRRGVGARAGAPPRRRQLPVACGSPTPSSSTSPRWSPPTPPGRERAARRSVGDAPSMRSTRTATGWRVACEAGDGGEPTVAVDVVVNAAGAWGDVVAARAGIAPLGLRPLRRTACLVPAPPDVSAVAARDGRRRPLLLRARVRRPAVVAGRRASQRAARRHRRDGGRRLGARDARRGDDARGSPRAQLVGGPAHVHPGSRPGGRLGARAHRASCGSSARVVRASRPRRRWRDAAAAIVAGGTWPDQLAALGVGPEELSPRRFR